MLSAFVIQFKQLKNLPLLSWEIPPQGGETYNPLLRDVSVMEEQAGHMHVKGFKMGGGHLENYTHLAVLRSLNYFQVRLQS